MFYHRVVYPFAVPLVAFVIACAACSSSHPSDPGSAPSSTTALRPQSAVAASAAVPRPPFPAPGVDAGGTVTTPLPPQPGGPITVPADYVSIFGGWTHPSCIHQVPQGAGLQQDPTTGTTTVSLNGSVIATYPDCGYRPIKGSEIAQARAANQAKRKAQPQSKAIPMTGECPGNEYYCSVDGDEWSGWAEWTEQDPSSPNFYSGMYAYGYVPGRPSNDGATYGYFTGWESTTEGNYCDDYILQPVLQWGASPAGGYTGQWFIGVWYWSGPGQFYEGVSEVSPGDEIAYSMWADWDSGQYYVEIQDEDSGDWWYLYVPVNDCVMDRSFVTMEVAGDSPILSYCDQTPQSPQDYVDFWDITLYDQNWNPVTYSPNITQNPIASGAGAPLDTCGFAVWSGNFGGGYGYGSTLWQ